MLKATPVGVCHHDSFNLGLVFKDGLLPGMPSCCNSCEISFHVSSSFAVIENCGLVDFSEVNKNAAFTHCLHTLLVKLQTKCNLETGVNDGQSHFPSASTARFDNFYKHTGYTVSLPCLLYILNLKI